MTQPVPPPPPIDIQPDHWAIVHGILQKHVPQHAVWAFGSRATGNAKPFSDLDLAIITDAALPPDVSASLRDDFSESDLPWKVDVIDWATTSEAFRAIVERDRVAVQEGAKGLASPNAWRIATLGELTVNHDGKRRPVKESDRRKGPYPYYGASGIVDHVDGFLFDGDYLLIAEDGENLRTRQTPVAFMARGKSWVNNHAHIVTGNDKADTRFLMYAIQGADISGYLTGAVMPKLTQGNLNRIELDCPPLDEQRAIAHILGTLDDKIELLRKQNETLEAMARALFRAWFVDFEPVRAKLEGRWRPGQSLPGLPAHLYDLFPDRLVDSELGEIPEGWEIARVSEFMNLLYGKSLPAGDWNPGIVPVYGSGGITGYHDTALVKSEAVIVGRKGTVGSLYWEQQPSFPIDTVFYVQPKVSLPFCFHLLDSLPLREMNTDAAVPGLNRENVYRLNIASPPKVLLDDFSSSAEAMRSQMFAFQNEARSLANLRDSLLPKLISGQLRVPDAERIAGVAV